MKKIVSLYLSLLLTFCTYTTKKNNLQTVSSFHWAIKSILTGITIFAWQLSCQPPTTFAWGCTSDAYKTFKRSSGYCIILFLVTFFSWTRMNVSHIYGNNSWNIVSSRMEKWALNIMAAILPSYHHYSYWVSRIAFIPVLVLFLAFYCYYSLDCISLIDFCIFIFFPLCCFCR